MGLWQDVCESAPATQNGGPSTEQLRMRRAVALAAEGFDRKACAALLSRGVCEEIDENVQRLRELHPEAPLPACPAPAELPMSIEITTEMVESALRSFPRDSAAGPSGLRAQHMVDTIAPAHRGTVLEQLAAAVQVAVRGEAPEAVAPYMAGATLLGLVKDGGGVRPTAIGEVFRRLVGKVLWQGRAGGSPRILRAGSSRRWHAFFVLRVRRAREPLTPAVCWGRLEKMAASREKGRNTCTETATHNMC